jgi:hypothetical protein
LEPESSGLTITLNPNEIQTQPELASNFWVTLKNITGYNTSVSRYTLLNAGDNIGSPDVVDLIMDDIDDNDILIRGGGVDRISEDTSSSAYQSGSSVILYFDLTGGRFSIGPQTFVII